MPFHQSLKSACPAVVLQRADALACDGVATWSEGDPRVVLERLSTIQLDWPELVRRPEHEGEEDDVDPCICE